MTLLEKDQKNIFNNTDVMMVNVYFPAGHGNKETSEGKGGKEKGNGRMEKKLRQIAGGSL